MDVQKTLAIWDELLGKNKIEEAELHLKKHIMEAEEQGDWGTQVSLLNERMGFYRNQKREVLCLQTMEEVLRLMKEHNLQGSVSYGTTLLNAATGLQAFGKTEQAVIFFEKALELYKEQLSESDYRLAGLYNNMASSYQILGDFVKTENYLYHALELMRQITGGEMELAMTHMNIAGFFSNLGESLKAEEHKKLALEQFDHPNTNRDGYYAHTCLKCAEGFALFGDKSIAEDLKERAERIYERT